MDGELKMEERKSSAAETSVKPRAIAMGCACVVFSGFSPEDLENFKFLHPENLILRDETGNQIFEIDIDDGPGSIEPDKMIFSHVTSTDGKATITVLLDPEIPDKMNIIQRTIGATLIRLDALEAKLQEKASSLQLEKESLAEQVMLL